MLHISPFQLRCTRTGAPDATVRMGCRSLIFLIAHFKCRVKHYGGGTRLGPVRIFAQQGRIVYGRNARRA
jgi:hypothetical protein